MKYRLRWFVVIALPFLIVACEDPSTIRVENTVRGGVLKNVRWGSVLLSEELLPGERSQQRRIYDNSSSGIDLPEENSIAFYLEINGDIVFLETREQFQLDINDNLEIVINDSTAVYNSLVDD